MTRFWHTIGRWLFTNILQKIIKCVIVYYKGMKVTYPPRDPRVADPPRGPPGILKVCARSAHMASRALSARGGTIKIGSILINVSNIIMIDYILTYLRCWIIASSSCTRFEGFGCSPIKAVRDLSSERGDTVRFLSTKTLSKHKKVIVRKDPYL